MKEFLDFIVEYGFMTVFSGLSLYLLFEYVKQKLFIHKRIIRRPIDHMFFTTISKYKDTTVKNMRVFYSDKKNCPYVKKEGYCKHCEVCTSMVFSIGRTMLVRKLLTVKFEEWRKYMIEATNKAVEVETFKEVYDIYTNAIMGLINSYEGKWREENIPEIVIIKFNEWHSNHAQVFFKGVERSCMGKSFNSVDEVCNSILHLSEALVIQTILDAEETLGSLNGSLSGKRVILDGKKYIIE